jgi:Zn-finger nucleic acid-binding protein
VPDPEPLDRPHEDVTFDWVLPAANDRFSLHGRELFHVRTIALRVVSVIGFAGVFLARSLQTTSRPLAILTLVVAVLPAIAAAPGLVVATLAAARGEAPSPRMLADHASRAPGFALLSIIHWLAVAAVPLGILDAYVELRLSLARFVFIDKRRGVFGALRESVLLTDGTLLAQVKLAVVEPLDALRTYGFLRAGIDGRVRASIGDALVYDYLSGNLAPPPTEASSSPKASGETLTQTGDASRDPFAPLPSPVSLPSTVSHAAPPPPVLDPTRPRCPRCRDVLLRVCPGPLAILGCEVCTGVWVDAATSRDLASNRLNVVIIELVLRAIPSSANKPRERAAEVHCPICGVPASRRFLAEAGVTVDACALHGTWFDDGEFLSTARGIAKTARDREDVASLLATPREQENVYLRGIKVGAAEALSAASEVVRTGVDSALEGREEDRTRMFESAGRAAFDIITRGDDAKDDSAK